jgi:hypothetical protein
MIKEESVAIEIKQSMNGLGAIKKLGIKQPHYDWLAGSGVLVKLTSNEFKLFPPAEWAEAGVVTVPVGLTTLQSLNAGTLTAMQKVTLRAELTEAIEQMMAEAGTSSVTFAPIDVKPMPDSWKVEEAIEQPVEEVVAPAPGVLGKLPPIKHIKEPVPGAWPIFPSDKMISAHTIKLRDATMMYQPVKGSDSTSRYFVVAANKDLRVAARFQNQQLSVRIEGPAWEKYAPSIVACGFDKVLKEKGYASLHLAVGPDVVLASKTLGAILLGLGIPMDTPLPSLSIIKGA